MPEGLELDHLCRRRHCVADHHLELVTREGEGEKGLVSAAVRELLGRAGKVEFLSRVTSYHGSTMAGASLGGFGVVILLSRAGFEADSLEDYRGLNARSPWFAAVMMVLVLLEGDFGNTLMLAAITVGMLFAAGAPLRLFAAMAGVGVPIFCALAASAAQQARVRKIGGTAILDERRRPICFGRCSCVWKRRSRPRARDEGRTGQAPRRHAGPPLRPCAGVTAGTPPFHCARMRWQSRSA